MAEDLASAGADPPSRNPSPLDRALRVFTDVRTAEGATGLILLANIFLVLAAYYFLKPVRDGWLASSAIEGLSKVELKAYSSFAQGLLLVVLIPLYARLTARWPRRRLISRTGLFFLSNLVVFWALQPGLLAPEIPYAGVAFYLWVGIFSVTIVAQFWSFAADLYRHDRGQRLFPLIMVGASSGAVVGSWITEQLVSRRIVDPFDMLLLATLPLAAALLLSRVADRRGAAPTAVPAPPDERPAAPDRSGAFGLIARHRYLAATALLMVLVNWVVSNGENFLFAAVQQSLDTQLHGHGALDPAAVTEFVKMQTTAFYGKLYFWVNLSGLLLQAFVVSRLLKYGGFATVMLAPPLVSLISYSTMATAPTALPLLQTMKTAENSTNYSVTNTARQVLWLPTTPEMMYKAKAAIDTFFVRFGDGLAALTVAVGTRVLHLALVDYLLFNIVLIVAWAAVAMVIVRGHRALVARARGEGGIPQGSSTPFTT